MQAVVITKRIPKDRYALIAHQGQGRGLGRIRLKPALSDSARSNFLEEIKINPFRFRFPHIKDYMESK